MQEHHLAVTRTARYASLGAPGPDTRELWIVCHGYGQLAGRFLRAFEPLDDGTRWILAPEALNRFYLDNEGGPHGPESRVGATWMTREDRLTDIRDYVAYLDTLTAEARRAVDAGVPVVALGFSQGVATVARWAAQGAMKVNRLVLWASLLPPDLDLAAAQSRLSESRPLFVAGRGDDFLRADAVDRQVGVLREKGITPTVLWYDGGHRIEAPALREVAEMIRRG